MGSGLGSRRGILPKPPECKPPPPKPKLPSTCLCTLSVDKVLPGPTAKANFTACHLLNLPDSYVSTMVSSVPSLPWAAGVAASNCNLAGYFRTPYYSTGTVYTVTALHTFVGGQTCLSVVDWHP